MELFIGDLSLQVDPAPLLCVVHPTEAGDIDHTLLVHVHITGVTFHPLMDKSIQQ